MLTIALVIVAGLSVAWVSLRHVNRRSKALFEWKDDGVTSLNEYKQRYKISGKRGKSKARPKTPRKK